VVPPCIESLICALALHSRSIKSDGEEGRGKRSEWKRDGPHAVSEEVVGDEAELDEQVENDDLHFVRHLDELHHLRVRALVGLYRCGRSGGGRQHGGRE